MLYYDHSNEVIKSGFDILDKTVEKYDNEFDKSYVGLLHAISKGEGFNFMTSSSSLDLRKSDIRDVLKELLYAIETERITDHYTRRNIVEEVLENLLGNYAD